MIEPAYRYRATTNRVVDGDTYYLDVDLGFRVAVTLPVRLRGIDCPEMNTPEGKAARAFVVGLLQPERLPTPVLLVESFKDRQTFARWVADVWLPDGWMLADVLLESNHAVEMTR